MSDLRPCPFCNAMPTGEGWIEHTQACYFTQMGRGPSAYADLSRHWNTRTSDAQAEKLANALRDTINMVDAMRHLLDQQRMLRLCAARDAIATYDATKGTK